MKSTQSIIMPAKRAHSTAQRDIKQFFQIFDFTHELCKKKSQKQLWRFPIDGRKSNINNSIYLNLWNLCARLLYWCYFWHHKASLCMENQRRFNFMFDVLNKQLLYIECLRLIKYSISSKSIISLDAQWDETYLHFWMVFFIENHLSWHVNSLFSWEYIL
jgi:hypothetical protein